MRAGGGATHASPDHWRADEISDAGRLDGHGGDGIVCADLQELRAGDRALSGAGNHGDCRAVRKRAGLFVTRVADGEAKNRKLGECSSLESFCGSPHNLVKSGFRSQSSIAFFITVASSIASARFNQTNDSSGRLKLMQ